MTFRASEDDAAEALAAPPTTVRPLAPSRSSNPPSAAQLLINYVVLYVVLNALLIAGLTAALDAVVSPGVAIGVVAGYVVMMIATAIFGAGRAVQNAALSTPAERIGTLFGIALTWPCLLILQVVMNCSSRAWRTPPADGRTYRPPIDDHDIERGVGTRLARRIYAMAFAGAISPFVVSILGFGLDLAMGHSVTTAVGFVLTCSGLTALLVIGSLQGPQRQLDGVKAILAATEPMTDDEVAAMMPDVDRAIIERFRASMGRAFGVSAEVIRPDLSLENDVPMRLHAAWIGAWLSAEVFPLRGRGFFVLPTRGTVADVIRLVQTYVRTP